MLAGALASASLSAQFSSAPPAAVGFGVGVLAVVSAAIALYALVPTLRGGEPASLIYFEHVARKYGDDTAGHAAAVENMLANRDEYFEQIAAQV